MAAARAGVEERPIAAHTRHMSMTVLRRYTREDHLFGANAASGSRALIHGPCPCRPQRRYGGKRNQRKGLPCAAVLQSFSASL